MKKYIILIFILVVSKTGFSQDIIDLYLYDTMKLKEMIFLSIRLDQIKSGAWIGRTEQVKITDSLLNSIQIRDVKSSVIPEDLTFFEVIINKQQTIPYLLCYNTSFQQFYNLSGFYNNEFKYLFDYLELKGFIISTQYFKRKGISVSGMNFECSIPIYLSIKQKKIKALGHSDRSKFPCLKYNFQPNIH